MEKEGRLGGGVLFEFIVAGSLAVTGGKSSSGSSVGSLEAVPWGEEPEGWDVRKYPSGGARDCEETDE